MACLRQFEVALLNDVFDNWLEDYMPWVDGIASGFDGDSNALRRFVDKTQREFDD
jgi:hypothetical protein